MISHELRDQAYADSDPHDLFGRYQEACSGLVIFTFGNGPLWYSRTNGGRKIAWPYPIEPLDTTGAGDAFRGAIAYGLWRNWDDPRTVDFACAVAACVCLSVPHALNAPDLDGVLAFMEQNRR